MNINITQSIKPIRLAFLINPKDKEAFDKCVRLSTSLWGGMYSLILPFYRRLPKSYRDRLGIYGVSTDEYYINIFETYEIDFLVYAENVSMDQSKIFEVQKMLPLKKIEESIMQNSQYGISLDEIMPKYLEDEFKFLRNDQVRPVLFNSKDRYLNTLYGNISEAFKQKLFKCSPLADLILEEDILRSNFHTKTATSKSYFDFNNFLIPQYKNKSGRFALIFVDDSVNDMMIFWNLRSLGWNITMIPTKNYKSEEFKRMIDFAIKSFLLAPRFLEQYLPVFVNRQVLSKTELEQIEEIIYSINSSNAVAEDKFQIHLTDWYPRVWVNSDDLKGYDGAFAQSIISSSTNKVVENTDIVNLPLEKPIFLTNKWDGQIKPIFTNVINIRFSDPFCNYSPAIPRMLSEEINKLYANVVILDNFGMIKNNLIYYINRHSFDINFIIPKSENIFELLFERHGLQIVQSSAGILSKAVLQNLGGIFGVNFFSNKGILSVLELFENGKDIHSQTLFGTLSRERKAFSSYSNLNDVVKKLINYKIIELGVKVSCMFCNRSSFFDLKNSINKLQCPFCLNSFDLPYHDPEKSIKWTYKGKGAFALNNRANGILCTLLTLRFFKVSLGFFSVTSHLSFDVLKKGKTVNEIDLAIVLKKEFGINFSSDLIFCECKTEGEFLDVDIERMKQLGNLFPNSILTFATLKDSLSSKEKQRINKLANSFRRGNKSRPICPILILTSNELIKNSFNIYTELKDSFDSEGYSTDDIGFLCDVLCQKYLSLKPYRDIVNERFTKKLQ